MTPTEIAARLDGLVNRLAVAGRRAPPRHATLSAAIDWSYKLLDERQRRVFERLSVFHRGCTITAAREVCSDNGVAPGAVDDLLDQLVAHSLVTATRLGEHTHYSLLETVRAFAAARLEQREQTTNARDRHADHYLKRVERMLEDHAGWRARGLPFKDEFEEVRAAVRWCLNTAAPPERAFLLVGALWPTAVSRHAKEIATLAEATLAQQPTDHPTRLHALGAAATAHLSAGDAAAAQTHADDALRLERRAGFPALTARRAICLIALEGDDIGQALERTRDLVNRARAAGDQPLMCEIEGFLAQLLHLVGDTPSATALADDMRMRADQLGSHLLMSWSAYVTAAIMLKDDPATASRWLTQSLALAREITYHQMVVFSLRALGLAELVQQRRPQAAERLLEALGYHEATTNPSTHWATLFAIAPLLAACNRDQPAAALLAATQRRPSAPLLAASTLATELADRASTQLKCRMAPQSLAAATAQGRSLDLTAAKGPIAHRAHPHNRRSYLASTSNCPVSRKWDGSGR